MFVGTPGNVRSTRLALLGSTICDFVSNLREGGEERQVLSGQTDRRVAPGLPLPPVLGLSPPEVLSAEQQHLPPAAGQGPGDLSHLRAEAQLVQTPRA